jgi:UDP-N-acetylglucosamine 2-epimerase (non-hydrolysing)
MRFELTRCTASSAARLRSTQVASSTSIISANGLIGTNPDNIKPALDTLFAGQWKKGGIPPLWDGHAAERIVEILVGL